MYVLYEQNASPGLVRVFDNSGPFTKKTLRNNVFVAHMADVEFLRSQLKAYPDFPSKVSTARLRSRTYKLSSTNRTGNNVLGHFPYPSESNRVRNTGHKLCSPCHVLHDLQVPFAKDRRRCRARRPWILTGPDHRVETWCSFRAC